MRTWGSKDVTVSVILPSGPATQKRTLVTVGGCDDTVSSIAREQQLPMGPRHKVGSLQPQQLMPLFTVNQLSGVSLPTARTRYA